jgi:hypothetical protein
MHHAIPSPNRSVDADPEVRRVRVPIALPSPMYFLHAPQRGRILSPLHGTFPPNVATRQIIATRAGQYRNDRSA